MKSDYRKTDEISVRSSHTHIQKSRAEKDSKARERNWEENSAV